MEVIRENNVHKLPDDLKHKKVVDLSVDELNTVIRCGINDHQAKYMLKGYYQLSKKITKDIIKKHCTI
jgi:hypothetical protein